MPRRAGLPRGAISNGGVVVLDAVMRGAVSHNDLIEATGFSRSNVNRWVRLLCDQGILIREEGLQGTLRPGVEVVAQIDR